MTTIQNMQNNPKLRVEIVAGLSTFFSMVYIALITPDILSPLHMDTGAVFVATCIASAIGCILMGTIAKLPIGVAPGIAITAYFATVLTRYYHLDWQSGITAVLIASIALIIITSFKVQNKIIKSLPDDFFPAICAGLGFFLCFIAMHRSGILFNGPNGLEFMSSWSSSLWVFIFGLALVIILDYYKVFASFLITIIASTILASLLGLVHYHGAISTPPPISPILLQFNMNALTNLNVWIAAFCLLMITLFDSTGTIVGLVQGIKDEDEYKLKAACSKGIFANSISSLVGGLLGVTTTSTFLESATGIRSGGRSGVTAIIIGACFILTIFLSPIARTIPSSAIDPILYYVGILMIRRMLVINWKNIICGISCAIIIIIIPGTSSIANGVGAGVISLTLLSLFSSTNRRKLNPILISLSAIFALYFAIITFI